MIGGFPGHGQAQCLLLRAGCLPGHRCDNFTHYQRYADGEYQIVPTEKQKAFLRHIITAEECFHFSEVTHANQ